MKLIYILSYLCLIAFVVAYNFINEASSLYALLIFWLLFAALAICLISTMVKQK